MPRGHIWHISGTLPPADSPWKRASRSAAHNRGSRRCRLPPGGIHARLRCLRPVWQSRSPAHCRTSGIQSGLISRVVGLEPEQGISPRNAGTSPAIRSACASSLEPYRRSPKQLDQPVKRFPGTSPSHQYPRSPLHSRACAGPTLAVHQYLEGYAVVVAVT